MGISRLGPRTDGRCIDEFRKVNVWLKIYSLFLLALHAHVLNFKMMGKPNWWNRSVANKKRKNTKIIMAPRNTDHELDDKQVCYPRPCPGYPGTCMGYYRELRSTMRSTFYDFDWSKVRDSWTNNTKLPSSTRPNSLITCPYGGLFHKLKFDFREFLSVRLGLFEKYMDPSSDLCSKWPRVTSLFR